MDPEQELQSSDSEDEDYNPAAEPAVSDDSDVETGDANSQAKRGRGKRKKKGKKRGALASDDEDEGVDYNKKLKSDEDESNEDDNAAKEAEEAEQKKAKDKLWEDFLNSVEEDSTKKNGKNTTTNSSGEDKTITKEYNFAGETVKVEEKVKSNQTNGKSKNVSNGDAFDSSTPSTSNGTSSPDITKASSSPPKRRSGGISFLSGSREQIGLDVGGKRGTGTLSTVLQALKAKKEQQHQQKMSTLDKSKLDWQSYKKEEGMEEELQIHTKSKQGFLEKQDFLQRTDIRQFEIEKNIRSRSRRNPL